MSSGSLAANGSTAVGDPLGAPGWWHAVFDDEFSTAALDPTKWTTGWYGPGVTKPVNPGELNCYDPANVVQSGGTLRLSLTDVASTCGGRTRPYTGSLVSTSNLFTVTYGFIEARMYMPGDLKISNWPAFWGIGVGTWPVAGELDVLEGIGGRACGFVHGPSTTQGKCPTDFDGVGWHTFGADWSPGKVTFYQDGHSFGTYTGDITSVPMYLVLGNTTNAHPAPQVPTTMQIDYVRVWQH